MKKALTLLLALLMTASAVSCAKEAADTPEKPAADEDTITLFVSPDGSDGADGSSEAPLATLAGAKAKVRELLQDAEKPITVVFREGDYIMTESVAFDAEDSGRDGAPVTYKAEDGARVRLTGGIHVPAGLITEADPEASVTKRVIDDNARAELLQADVSSLTDTYPALFHCDYIDTEARTDHYVGDWNSMGLFLGETPLMPARWPNLADRQTVDFFEFDPNKAPLFDYDSATITGTETAVMFLPDDVIERSERWSDESLGDAFITGYLRHHYLGNRVKILELDRGEKSVHCSPSANGLGLSIVIGGFFENIPEEIDVRGESYIDRDARIAYFYPTEDFDADDVWLSVMTVPMMTFDATEHIAFEGIEFCYTRDSVVVSHNVNDFTMEDCRMVHLSSRAAFFFDAENVRLNGCEIGDTEHGGLYVSGGDRVTLESAGIVIENCDFHDVNRDWFSNKSAASNEPAWNDPYCCEYPAAITCMAVGTVIRHNEFHDIRHCAIVPESNDILIEYNEFARCVTHAADMACIYYHWNPTFLGMTIRYNYFHEIGSCATNVQFAIYCDNGATGPEVYGNLFVDAAGFEAPDTDRSRKGVMAMTQFTHFYNNVAVSAPLLFRYDDWNDGSGSRQTAWVARNYGFNLSNKYGGSTTNFFLEVDFTGGIWKQKYGDTFWGGIFDLFDLETLAEFQTITDEKKAKNKAGGIAPARTNVIENNVLVDIGALANDGNMLAPGQHDNLLDGGLSLFTDPENGDYSFTQEGLARVLESCPGFVELPLDEIGIRK